MCVQVQGRFAEYSLLDSLCVNGVGVRVCGRLGVVVNPRQIGGFGHASYSSVSGALVRRGKKYKASPLRFEVSAIETSALLELIEYGVLVVAPHPLN
jgi:hypothetical protein